ncbi:MAG TPA: DNA recombination protein RmuC [Rubrivivax sp.]|nr:DNA recombination protein RmuC [Burkholderiales bacterium]HNT40244.1 DNA recombination protein RmuC [Rubrivivax sp.]
MPDWTLGALLALAALNLLMLAWLLLRGRETHRSDEPLAALRLALQADVRTLERELREELARLARAQRQDLAALQSVLLAQSGEHARSQFEQLRQLAHEHERRAGELRTTVEARLTALHEGNERKLEQMRATVDEKLHATLEQRLGESFRLVAERLEQVHQGLGEMQGLARDVGSLSRVLGNVKARGVFGEVQLAALIEQVFTPAQYATNVAPVPGRAERVEFALRLPGPRADGAPLWLPIDAKFPREDYERLLDAQERADAPAAEASAKAIEAWLRQQARLIRDKYVAPPHTTDFALLFLPTEGLYAEVLRRPGLVEALQRDTRVVVAGPTTLLAILNSLQMGFRTLALEQRSTEVWEVLGAVKTEFTRFGEVLLRTRRKLDEAGASIDAAQVRTRAMARELERVQALPDPSQALDHG